MRAPKLVQHFKDNSDSMSERLLEKIRNSPGCRDLMLRVPAEEHKRYALDVYRDLAEWLASETNSVVESRYVELGARRAQQGVPFNQLFWAVCITREYLWEYIQQECLLDEPVEFWGGMGLLRSLTQFFDRAVYAALVAYQKSGASDLAGAHAVFL
jgi:hypothetical protein